MRSCRRVKLPLSTAVLPTLRCSFVLQTEFITYIVPIRVCERATRCSIESEATRNRCLFRRSRVEYRKLQQTENALESEFELPLN